MIEDLISNEEVKRFLKNELKLSKKSGTYLFYGNDNTLVEKFAKAFIKGLACEEMEFDYCDSCDRCRKIDREVYSDFEIIEDENGIKVDAIRELIEKSTRSSYEGNKKFFLIKDIGKMKKEAGNALLKLIEEPSENNYFILLNNNLNILSTIKSRCILTKIKNKTLDELGVTKEEYEFFSGKSEEIEEYKELNIDLKKQYSYQNIESCIKEYEEKKTLESKVDIYKALRDYLDNCHRLEDIEKIYFAEKILESCNDKNTVKEIVRYIVERLADFKNVSKRIEYKMMLNSNINLKLYLTNFFLEI